MGCQIEQFPSRERRAEKAIVVKKTAVVEAAVVVVKKTRVNY